MRTYLYVDGENFAIRAGHFDAELKKDAGRADALKKRANARSAHWEGADALSVTRVWSPEPHRDAIEAPRMRRGILYSRDELYWDSLGLFIALKASLPDDYESRRPDVERAYYFGSASGDRIAQHTRDLHALGFSPNVSIRVKPDNWTKQKANEGIYVISRPKPVDILIATRVLEDCAADNFDQCIFVGGDEDFVSLLEAVRRRGKRVWLVAFERWIAQDQQLRFACDRFIAYDPVLSVRPLPTQDAGESST